MEYHVAGEAKGRRLRARLRCAPRVVVHRRQRQPQVVDRQPHAAQRVPQVPGFGRTNRGREALPAIQVIHRGHPLRGLQHLAQRRGQVLGVARRHPSCRLRHQHIIPVVVVAGRAALGQAVARIIGVRGRAIAGQITGVVVGPTTDLVDGMLWG